jgi:SpoVK/Ycf46/Vps4 family AAA+-type ATPase
LRVELGYPAAPARRTLWDEALAERGLAVDAASRARIASRFSLNPAQIRQAAADAQMLALSTGTQAVSYAELAIAARQQCGSELARMAQRVTPRADFSELVVPAEVQAQLREICIRVATRDEIGRDWADRCVHARTTGVTALFVGPSGTGKTLSAEAVAHELGLDLYRIDLAGIVSKYIGETEKNLDRVFASAENANAVLFFDEADALFGKRSEVKDAHDRYANIEIAYLLQKMEQFDGLAVLATNLKQNLDEAFARRLTFTVTFPFPEEPERRKLWEQLWPPRAVLAEDIDLAWFAREFRLSGGNIRNAVMAAAHLAAADGKVVTHDHLMHATRREFQKLGKNLVHVMAGGRVAR